MGKKTSYKNLIEINNVLVSKIDSSKRDKLSLCINDFIQIITPTLEAFNKKSYKLSQELCSVDKNGDFYLDEKNNPIFSKFTRENGMKREQELEKLLNEEVEVETVNCTDLSRIKTLHISYITLLNGFLFNLSKEKIEEIFIENELVPAPVSPN